MSELDIDTTIKHLQEIRQKHGNLPIYTELGCEDGAGPHYGLHLTIDIGKKQNILDSTLYNLDFVRMIYDKEDSFFLTKKETTKCVVFRKRKK